MKTGPAGRSLWLPSLGSGIPASRFPTVETILDFCHFGSTTIFGFVHQQVRLWRKLWKTPENSRPLIRLDSVGSQSAETVISTSPAGLLESRQPWSNREENKNEMSFRFQRRIRLAPGLHLNVSKSGVGFSAGPRGFHVGVDSRRRLDSRRRPYVSAGTGNRFILA